MELTAKEQQALLAIARHGMDQMGGKKPADLHHDNFSWFDTADMMDFAKQYDFELTKHQCAGLISSLEDKGLVADNCDGKNSLYLSEAGIDEAQIIFDAPTTLRLKSLEQIKAEFDAGKVKVTIIGQEVKINPKTEKEPIMNTINGIVIAVEADLDQFSNKELVTKYNELQVASGRGTIVKFSDHATAVRRTYAALILNIGAGLVADVCPDCNATLNASGECGACNKLFEDAKPEVQKSTKPLDKPVDMLASSADFGILADHLHVSKPEIVAAPAAVVAVTPRVKGTKALTTEIFDTFFASLPKKEVIAKCVAAGLKQSSSEAFYSDWKKAHPVQVPADGKA